MAFPRLQRVEWIKAMNWALKQELSWMLIALRNHGNYAVRNQPNGNRVAFHLFDELVRLLIAEFTFSLQFFFSFGYFFFCHSTLSFETIASIHSMYVCNHGGKMFFFRDLWMLKWEHSQWHNVLASIWDDKSEWAKGRKWNVQRTFVRWKSRMWCCATINLAWQHL